ncbi:MAG: hypothetical protein KDI55_28905, partial [Anaerolineae bacterium]|nr:hypothetical protein [Anaerolineae bacterium]
MGNGRFRIRHFYNQFLVSFISQFNDNAVVRVVDVPKNAPAVLEKRTRFDHAGKIRAGQLDAAPPITGRFRVGANIGNM